MTAERDPGAPLTCDEVGDLIGAYALDALEPAERAAVDAHLEGCALHAELRELQGAAAAVALAVDSVEPPPHLRARIAAIADAADRSVPGRVRDRASWLRLLRRPAVAYAFAAVLGVVALLVGVGIGSGGGDSTRVVAVTDGTGEGDHRLVYVAEERVAVLEIHGLADLAVGETYQVWLIRGDGSPRSLGLFVTHSGVAAVALSVALEAGDVIAVTVEPAGGSPQPTSAPLVSGTV